MNDLQYFFLYFCELLIYRMEKKKILYISQEICPYMNQSSMGDLSGALPQIMQESGRDIRIFLPRFGTVNERRHQLHEVIRLSGMNLIIDDFDHQLIIKVASIQQQRMQVYFIDNDDYFKGRGMYSDGNGKLFSDNDERAIFFAKGVIETVKKLNWSPDIIHVHGWMSALLPIYLKEIFKNEPIFQKSKIVTSLYSNEFEKNLNKDMINKVLFDEIDQKSISDLKDPTYENLMRIAINYSDGIIIGSENLSSKTTEYLKSFKNPILEFQPKDSFSESYTEFYNNLFD